MSISKEKTNAGPESNSCHSADRFVISPGVFVSVGTTIFLSVFIGPKSLPTKRTALPSSLIISNSEPIRD